jgi:transposase-like protein
LPLRLSRHQWRALLRCHVQGFSAQAISRELALPKTRVLRALTVLRQAMTREVPPILRGTVEVDETYVGGTWKNRRYGLRDTPRGRGTLKTPVFGILCRGGQVWAQVVPDITRETLQGLIRRRVQCGSTVWSDTLASYTGIATKGYVHRLVRHEPGRYASHGRHINGLEGFWGYLKRRLAAKGGIRRERLPLYLAEYVWRYNHRRLSVEQQIHQLTILLIQSHRHPGGRSRTLPFLNCVDIQV